MKNGNTNPNILITLAKLTGGNPFQTGVNPAWVDYDFSEKCQFVHRITELPAKSSIISPFVVATIIAISCAITI